MLRRLVDWMRDGIPPALPVLVIDDEADQASINTGGNRAPRDEGEEPPEEGIDPSVINGLIRKLLHSFRRVGYVAYTATPFANILINHEALDREVWEDLYPRDFLVNLPRLPRICRSRETSGTRMGEGLLQVMIRRKPKVSMLSGLYPKSISSRLSPERDKWKYSNPSSADC